MLRLHTAARRGARVTGIEVDPHFLRQANWAARILGLQDRVTFRQTGVYDLARWEEDYRARPRPRRQAHAPADVVPDPHHPGRRRDRHARGPGLRRPQRDGAARLAAHAFIEKSLAGDPTNWWAPNHAGVTALLRSAGMGVIARPGHEIYLCEPAPYQAGDTWIWRDPRELDAATGRANMLQTT